MSKLIGTTVSTSVLPEDEVKGPLLRMGVIGHGYWGPNIIRNFHGQERSRVMAVCDKSEKALRRVRQSYPDMAVTTNAQDLVTATDIDVVAVVTPIWTHYELAKAALENGKHVFVEKPFTFSAAQAEELIELAERKNLKIMVDHTFLFTGAVKRIHQLIEDRTLGDLYYYDSTRVNLGLFQHDVNVIWDLAPHDLSIMDYLIEAKPEAVVATGRTHLNGVADIAFITLYLPAQHDRAHQRELAIAGEGAHHADRRGEKNAGVERSGSRRKDQGIRQRRADEQRRRVYQLWSATARATCGRRSGTDRGASRWKPRISLMHLENKKPFNDGVAGLRIVRMLEAADQSLHKKGKIITL